MKLRVVCQECGKTGIVRTDERDTDWNWLDATDFIDDLESYMSWDIWFCLDCCPRNRDDTREYLESILHITKGERKSRRI